MTAQIVTQTTGTALEVPVTNLTLAKRALANAGFSFSSLLSPPESNPKVAKNEKKGVLTSPLHLAPYDLSGRQVCPKASEGCAAACLHYTNPHRMKVKNKARIGKTNAYFEARPLFLSLLIREINSLAIKADRYGMQAGVRLNATSDIPWERVPISYGGLLYNNIMELFPDVSFYDYTKRPNRKNLPGNYHLTFSLSENNDEDAVKALKNGLNVAVVFDTKKSSELPRYMVVNKEANDQQKLVASSEDAEGSIPVIDGDEHDYRPSDPPGVIVGLRAKGLARSDVTGFVRSAE